MYEFLKAKGSRYAPVIRYIKFEIAYNLFIIISINIFNYLKYIIQLDR